jgi:hypothetical protein
LEETGFKDQQVQYAVSQNVYGCHDAFTNDVYATFQVYLELVLLLFNVTPRPELKEYSYEVLAQLVRIM